jgi:hypothetical protein
MDHVPQEATSSLMSYHYLKPFHRFCNFETHNREAPNPQNLYCKFRSVREVIERSPDWKRVTKSPRKATPPMNFKVVRNQKSKPLLYILLDGGISQVGPIIQKKLRNHLYLNRHKLHNI